MEKSVTDFILAIDTSCDETAAAVVRGRRVLANVIYSQALIHHRWGGVLPSLAKRAHEEKIDWVIFKALEKAKLNYQQVQAVAVTYGPGLAIALEVGIKKAKEIAVAYSKPLVAIDHMEGHLFSSFVQNSRGNPPRNIEFPYLALLISGGHTELVLARDFFNYQILGETRDDAVGESLDKAARLLGFGYPGGPVIEQLARGVNNVDEYHFPRPMLRDNSLDFSFSGLKTAFFYYLRKLDESEKNKRLRYLASSFQEAVFEVIVTKTVKAIRQTGVRKLLVGGGVGVNRRLRKKLRQAIYNLNCRIFFPPYSYLNFDNAAMIGVVASFRVKKGLFVTDINKLDRVPRLSLLQSSIN